MIEAAGIGILEVCGEEIGAVCNLTLGKRFSSEIGQY